jgi:hypothetical protein
VIVKKKIYINNFLDDITITLVQKYELIQIKSFALATSKHNIVNSHKRKENQIKKSYLTDLQQ